MKKELRFEFTADTRDFKDKLWQVRDDIDGFKKRVSDEEAIKLSMNVSTIQKQIELVKNKIKQAKESWDLEAEIKLWWDLELFKNSLTQAKRELRNYVRTWEADVSVLGKLFANVTDEIEKSRKELEKTWKSTQALDKIKQELNELNDEFRAGRLSVEKYSEELKNLQNKASETWWLDGFIEKISEFKWLLVWWAIVAGWVAVVEWVKDLDGALKKLSWQLWLSKDELWNLWDILDNLQATWFVSFDEWVKIISTLKKELNLTNWEIEKTSLWIANITNTFDKDFNEVLRANTALQKNFWITGNEANNIIISSLQRTWDTYDDLLDSINEYSAKAKDSWIEVGRFINVLIEGTNRGIRNTDELADVQREFAIRLQDWSKTSKDALDKLWISYDDLKKQIADWSITVWDAMQMIAGKIQDIEDPLEQVQIWTALMGTKFEDNGKIIVDVLADVGSDLWDISTKTDELVANTDTGINAMISSWQKLSNSLRATITPLVNYIAWQVANIFKLFNQLQNLSSEANKLKWWKPNQFKLVEDTEVEKVSKLERDYKNLNESIAKAKKSNSTEELKIYNKALEETNKKYTELTGKKLWVTKEIPKAVNNIESLSSKLTTLKTQLDKAEIWSDTFKKLQSEVKTTQNQIDKLQGKTWWWGWWVNKEAEKAKKDALKLEEEEKKKVEETKKAITSKAEENKKAYSSIISDIGKWVDSLWDYIKWIEKVNEEISNFKKSALSAIRDINQELKTSQEQTTESIASRYVEVSKRIDEVTQRIKEQQREWNSYTQETIEMEKELKKLNDEKLLARTKLTEKDIENAKVLDWLSETQKLIADNEKNTKVLEEKKKIYEDIANGQKINLDEIQNYENIKIAEDLTAKQNAFDSELQLQKDNLQKQRDAIIKLNTDRKTFEADWLKFFWTSIQKQLEFQKILQEQLLKTIELQKQAWIQGLDFWWKNTTPEQEKKVKENVQKLNTKTVNVTQNNYNLVDFQKAMSEINNAVE